MAGLDRRDRETIGRIVIGLDRWFDGTRVDWPAPGYGGPVVHWWSHCLAYQGAGLDWRYEGIIGGYLTLWRRTGDGRWLAKARRAGDDLVNGQREDGHFLNSRFELNPGVGGTPHEAACDVALASLARELRSGGDDAGERYVTAAERNLSGFYLARLWHDPSATLWDQEGVDSFVPNKAATFVEAILLLAELRRDDSLIARFAVPTGDRIVRMQVQAPGAPLDGAIAQNRLGREVIEHYFPLYVARCVPALLQLWRRTGESRFRQAALAAAEFVARVREPDGGCPQVIYGNGRHNRWPRWIAGAGDVVRALSLAAAEGSPVDSTPTVRWIMSGVRPDGRIAAAQGFGRVLPWRSRREAFADEVGVVGWCDKAFRVLSEIAEPVDLDPDSRSAPATPLQVTNVVR
jgi:hypothetical protein